MGREQTVQGLWTAYGIWVLILRGSGSRHGFSKAGGAVTQSHSWQPDECMGKSLLFHMTDGTIEGGS